MWEVVIVILFGLMRSFLVDESEFSFKMKDKEEEGGGNEGCRFWFIREDSEYFKMERE